MKSARLVRLTLLSSSIALSPWTAPAQGTAADYARAEGLRGRIEGLVVDAAEAPTWVGAGSNQFVYRKSATGGFNFMLVDAVTLEKRPAFDHDVLDARRAQAAKQRRQVDPSVWQRRTFEDPAPVGLDARDARLLFGVATIGLRGGDPDRPRSARQQLRLAGRAHVAVDDDRLWAGPVGQANPQLGIVRQHRPDTDQDRVVPRPQRVRESQRLRSAQAVALAARGGNAAVQALRVGQRDERPVAPGRTGARLHQALQQLCDGIGSPGRPAQNFRLAVPRGAAH